MTAPVVASAAQAYESSSPTNVSLTVTKPTGLAVGDLLVAFFWSHHSATISADTPPSGWTTAITRTETTGTENERNACYWKVATSTEVAATNFTFARTGGTVYGAWCAIARITGAAASAMVDVSDYQTTADTLTTVTFKSVTTTQADDLVLIAAGDFSGTVNGGTSWPNAAPTGFTLVSGASMSVDLGGFGITGGIASKAQATAGATGTATSTYSGGVDTFFVALTVAIKTAPSTGTTLTPGAGSLALSGKAPTVLFTTTLTPGAQALAISGKTPVVGVSLTLLPGAGALAISGKSPVLVFTNTLTPGAQALALSGKSPAVVYTFPSVSSNGALLGFGPIGSVPLGSVGASNLNVLPGAQALVITGKTPLLKPNTIQQPGHGALVISGKSPFVSYSGATVLTPGKASLLLTGHAPIVADNTTIRPGAQALTIGGYAPFIASWFALPVTAETWTEVPTTGETWTPVLPTDENWTPV